MPAMKKGGASRAPRSGSGSKSNKAAIQERAQANTLVNLWGIAGRREIMETRRLWQLRIPRR
jgi:hypothetical protein